MKKTTAFISILLALTMLLTSCSVKIKGKDDNTSSVESEEATVKATEIELNEEYDLTDDISFKMIKASETPVILDTAGSGKGYAPYSSDSTYIDLIFDITNESYADFDCNEDMNVEVQYNYTSSFQSYASDEDDDPLTMEGKFVGENDGWASVSTFSKAVVPAGETVRVHYFVAYIDAGILSPTYTFLVSSGDSEDNSSPVYKFDYKKSMGVLCESAEIKLKEQFTIENYANITLENVKFSTKLTPTSTWGSYTYYEVQEYGKTYLIFKFTVENLTEDVIVGSSSIHGFITGCTYGDSYYVSTTILEESNKKDLTQAGAIEAGKKNTMYVLFQVPTDFEKDNNYMVQFMAGGNFYTYYSENYTDGSNLDVSSETSSDETSSY